MATVTIPSASLTIAVSTTGLTALQSTSPTQLFTTESGQRAYTINDALGAMNEQINGNTDPTSTGPDAPDLLYTFQTSTDGMLIVDSFTYTKSTTLSKWDISTTYIGSTWQ
jgi:hypothetical protein